MQDYRELLTDMDLAEAGALLASAGLSLPEGRPYGLGYYEDGRMAACGFLADNILCGFCVAPQARGGGISTGLLSRLVLHGKSRGIDHFFIFTKAAEAAKFQASGFDLVAKSADAALLEQGRPDYADWLAATRETITRHAWPAPAAVSSDTAPRRALGAIVMNANPFTRGHDFLARAAAAACERLLVFVVEEDASVFPITARLRLVRQGLQDLGNALVLPAGPYMVSRASFPAYFTEQEHLGAVHAALDCAIFAGRIAPDLGIAARFVGTEPFDLVTRAYNDAMRRLFPGHGLDLREIPRLERDGTAVSASRVRALLRDEMTPERWERLSTLLPAVTFDFLRSEEGTALRRQLRRHDGRH